MGVAEGTTNEPRVDEVTRAAAPWYVDGGGASAMSPSVGASPTVPPTATAPLVPTPVPAMPASVAGSTAARPPKRQHEPARGLLAVGAVANGIWMLIVGLFAVAGLGLVAGGWIYGHSTEFKTECVAHKLVGYDMGSVRNLICDGEFDITADSAGG